MKFFSEIEDIIGTAVLVAIFGVTVTGVVFRYALNDSLLWSEEIGRLGLVAITFFGIGTGFRRGTHVAVDVSDWFSGRTYRLLRMIGLLVSAAFLLFLLIQSWQLSQILTFAYTAALRIPIAFIYMGIVLATTLGLLRVVMLMIDQVRGNVR